MPEVKEDFPVCMCAGRLLRGSEREGASPHNNCEQVPTGLCGRIHLINMLLAYLGGGSKDQSGVKKETR